MKITLDQSYLLAVMKKSINTPNPVSHYEEINPSPERCAQDLGCQVTYDRKGTGFLKIPGKDREKTICIGAYPDTLGLIDRRIDPYGMIRVRNPGRMERAHIRGVEQTAQLLAAFIPG